MGTDAHLIVGGAHEGLVEWAVDEVERLEQSWSRFRPGSELRSLLARPDEWVPVSRDLLLALSRARLLWEETAGAFDPTVLRSIEALGYDRTFRAVEPDSAAVVRSAVPPGFGGVEIDEVRGAVRLPQGVGIDLGGVGKGLAADLIAEGLVLRGAASALIGLGGDIRTAGEVPAGGWRIPVQDPFDPGRTWAEVVLGTEALVTSTSLMRRWRRAGTPLHHIIDPLTGSPTDTGVVAVVARGSEAWRAEGLAKAAIVLGEAAAPLLFEGTGVDATLFRRDGAAVSLPGWEALCSRP
jgi:thiamine biosynthesis lipoprotein